MSNTISNITVAEFISTSTSVKDHLVVDVRTYAEVDNEYYDGSINLPLQELSIDKLTELIEDSNKHSCDFIYLLCGSGIRAQKAAEQLAGNMGKPLVIIEGGINAMREAGVSLKKGEGKMISLERQVRIAAGTLVLVGAVVGYSFNPGFYALSAFVGAGLVFAGITDTCAMGMALAHMPWNRGR